MKAFKVYPARRRRLGLALVGGLLLVVAGVVYADVLNGGFETGDFTGWTPSGSYAIVNAGLDPWIPGLPRVFEGQYAAQIGDVSPMFPISSTWESRIFQATIVPALGDALELHYAAVALEAHPSGESAGYSLEMMDLTTGTPIYALTSYAYDTGVGNPPPPGWTRQYTIPANSLDYTPWQTLQVDLQAYADHEVRIEFRVFDCQHGEHWAYGYIDGVVLTEQPPPPTAQPTTQPTAQPTAQPTTQPAQPPVVPEAPTLVLFASAAAGMAGYLGLQWRARRRK